MRTIRKILFYGSLLLLMCLSILFMLSQTNWGRDYLKKNLVKQLNNLLLAEVKIGSLKGNLLEQIEFNDIEFMVDNDEIISVGKIYLSYDLSGLFHRELLIRSLLIDSLNFNFRQGPDQTWNWAGILQTDGDESVENHHKSSWKINLRDFLVKGAGRVEPVQEYPFFPLEISSFSLRGAFTLSDGEYEFNLKINEFITDQPDLGLQNISIEASSGGQMELKSGSLRVGGSYLTLQGEGNASPEYQVKVKITAAPLQLSDLRQFIPTLQQEGEISFQLVSIVGSDTLETNLELIADNQKADLDVTIINYSSDPDISLQAEIRAIDLSRWLTGEKATTDLNGAATAQLQGSNLQNLRGQIRINLAASRWGDLTLSELLLMLRGEPDNVTAELGLQSKAGELGLTGHLLKQSDYDITGWVRNLNLDFLPVGSAPETDLNLRYELKGSGLQPQEAELSILINQSDSRIDNIQLDTLYLDLDYKQERLFINKLEADNDLAVIRLQGEATLTGDGEASFNAEIRDLTQIKNFLPDLELAGSGSISGQWQGNVDNWEAELEIGLLEFQYRQYRSSLLNSQLGMSNRSKQLEASYFITLEDISLADLQLAGLEISGIYRQNRVEAGIELTRQTDQRILAELTVEPGDTLLFNIPVLGIQLGESYWQQFNQDLRVMISDSFQRISDLDLREGEQRISLNGEFNAGRSAQAAIAITLLDLYPISEMTGLEPMNGYLTLNVDLTGNLADPEIKGYLLLDEAGFRNTRLGMLHSGFAYRDQLLDISLNWEREGIPLIEGTILLPVVIDLESGIISVLENLPFHTELNSRNLDLNILTDFDQNLDEFKGLLNTTVKIGNTLAEPDLNAEITIKEGGIRSSRYGLDYKDIELALLADEHILDLVNLRALTDKKGVMSLQGQVNYAWNELDIDLEDFSLQLTARDFQAVRNRDIDLILNADIRLNGDQEKTDLTGDILVKKARIFLAGLLGGNSHQDDLPVPLLVQAVEDADSLQARIPKAISRKFFLPEKLQGRIRVEFPRNTWVYSPELNMELSGELDLVKSGRDFEIFGEVGVRRGNYTAYGRRFEIRQGNLYFSGGQELNPGLDIRAEYTFRDRLEDKRKLILIITGQALTPAISFFLEDNPLTEGDAISYILFGKSSNELTSGERSQLGQDSGEGLALNFLARRMTSTLSTALQNHLRLDVVEFSGDSDWRQAAIILGKYITNDLYLSYQREFSFGQSREIIPEQVSLEYELSRHFYLQATHGGEKASGFDLIWKFEK